MAQQTKNASSRSNGKASSSKRSASTGGPGPARAKPRGSAAESAPASLAAKLKTPAIAGGAALAGLAGGLALAKRSSPRKVLGVPVPSAQATSKNLAEAAQQIGSFGERMGELANEVRMVREGVAHSASRSPVEVVLQGLTSRRR